MAEWSPNVPVQPGEEAPLRLLLVEDEPGDARLIRAALRGQSVQRVQEHWVTSLAEVLALTEAFACDVVLLDLQLPDSAGLETVRRVRERLAAAPIIVLTGHEDSHLALAVIEAGAQDYLVKGAFDSDSLLRTIRYAISRARLVERMRESEERYREEALRTQTILDSVIDGIITIDRHGQILSLNRAAETIFGYPAEEAVGHNVTLLMPEPYRRQHDDYLAHYLATGERRIIGIGREVEGLRRDGSRFPLELSVSEIRRGEAPVFIGVVRDITERRRIDRMKNEFISTVSHELRTPLTSISGSLGLLAGGALGSLSEQAAQMVQIAWSNSQRLNLLINDLLDMEKVVAGKMRFDMQWRPLQPVVQHALEVNQSYAERFSVSYALRNEAPELVVQVDEQRLLQILANLLSNAAKFSPHGGRVEVVVKQREGWARVEVIDRGEGVDPAFRSRIFQKFSQADSSDTRSKGGTGLGLVISRELVQHMHGTIDFHSPPGQGATFFFELPLGEPPELPHP